MRAGLLVRFPTFQWFQAGEGARDHVLFFDWITPRFVVDLWQSEDSRSFLRVGAGVGATGRTDSKDWKTFAHYVSPLALVQLHLRSKTGLHNFDVALSAEPMFGVTGEKRESHSRMRGTAMYEMVLFAINEQPFSLYGEARYDYNDAVGLGYKPHEATFLLGGRLSFGAK